MEKTRKNLAIELIVFILGVLLSGIVLLTHEISFLTWAILLISLVYLVLGFFIFKSSFSEGHPFLLFFMGYLYASVFVAAVFLNTGWPMSKTVVSLSPVWAIIQVIIVFMIRKKLLKSDFIKFLLESVVLLILAILMIILYP